ncbi:hypothetical protein BSK66_07825 [Paenibacillus odorifer]|uniref:hypothetical protein n=1 Tax=Paenibacillus TaxID=44249 RepID=UPI0003E2A86D|nr:MULTISPECIES: hypothetical protein [Paenibacillus]ETT64911.1 hypothetical protein C171_07842 [Paenibacillus sp. FSL H8-237]OME61030.1 hypothetical protein BSK66_07825 [Paenibacillus odorifer]
MAYRKIKVPVCPQCGTEIVNGYCYDCRCLCQMVKRDRCQASGNFTVVDWFSSRSSAGLILEDTDGNRYPIYMSDVFMHLNGTDFRSLTLEETKKGSAYGWKIITKEAA